MGQNSKIEWIEAIDETGRYVIDCQGNGACNVDPADCRKPGGDCRLMLHDRKGGDMSKFPEGLRVRQFPEVRS